MHRIKRLIQIVREAFSDMLPTEVAWRQKELFPHQPAEERRILLAASSPSTSPVTLPPVACPCEASVACSIAIALEWDTAFKGMNAPSGRAVKGVHEQTY